MGGRKGGREGGREEGREGGVGKHSANMQLGCMFKCRSMMGQQKWKDYHCMQHAYMFQGPV